MGEFRESYESIENVARFIGDVAEILSKAGRLTAEDILQYLSSSDSREIKSLPEYERMRLPLTAFFIYTPEIEAKFKLLGFSIEESDQLFDLVDEIEKIDFDEKAVVLAKIRLLVELFVVDNTEIEETIDRMESEFIEGILCEYAYSDTKIPPVLLISLNRKMRDFYKSERMVFEETATNIGSYYRSDIGKHIINQIRRNIESQFNGAESSVLIHAFERDLDRAETRLDSFFLGPRGANSVGAKERWHKLPSELFDEIFDIDLLLEMLSCKIEHTNN